MVSVVRLRAAGRGERGRVAYCASVVVGVGAGGPYAGLARWGRGPVPPRGFAVRGYEAATACGCRAGSGLVLRSTRSVRIRKPIPTRSRAAPTTMAKVATRSAKKAVL